MNGPREKRTKPGLPSLLARGGLLLRPVLAPALFAVRYAGGVQGAPDNVVAHSGEIRHAPASDKNHGMLLQVMPFARDVGGHFHTIGEADARNLAQRGIGLLGGHRPHLRADAALLRRAPPALRALPEGIEGEA